MADTAVLEVGEDTQHHDGAFSQSKQQGASSESFELGHRQWDTVAGNNRPVASGSPGVHVWGEGHALRERCPCGCEGDAEDTSGLSWRDDGTAQTLNSDASLSNSPWDEEARRRRRLHVDPLAGWRTAFSDPAALPNRTAGLSLTSDLSGPFHAPTWPGVANRGGGSDLSSGHRPDYGASAITVGLRDPATMRRGGGGFEVDVVSNLRHPAIPPPDMGSVKMIRPTPTFPGTHGYLPLLSGTDATSGNATASDTHHADQMERDDNTKGLEGWEQGQEASPKAGPTEDVAINPDNWPSLADLWEKGLLYNARAHNHQLSQLCASGPAIYSCPGTSPHITKQQAGASTPSLPMPPVNSFAADHSRMHSLGLQGPTSELSHWVRNHWQPTPLGDGSGDSASLGWPGLSETATDAGHQTVPQGRMENEERSPLPADVSSEPVTLSLLNSPEHAPAEVTQFIPPSFEEGHPPQANGAAPFEFSVTPASNPHQPCLQLRLGPPEPRQATIDFHPAPTGASGLDPPRPSPPGEEDDDKHTRSSSATIHCHSPPLSPSPPPPSENGKAPEGQHENPTDAPIEGTQQFKEVSSRKPSPTQSQPCEQMSSQGSPELSPRASSMPMITDSTNIPSPSATISTAKTSSVGVQTDAIMDEAFLKERSAQQTLDGAQGTEYGRVPAQHSAVWNVARQQALPTGPQGPLSMTPIKVSSLPRRYSPSPPASPRDPQKSPMSNSKGGMLPSSNGGIPNSHAAPNGGPPGPNQGKQVLDPFLGLQFNVRPNHPFFTTGPMPPYPGSPATMPCARHGYLCRTPHSPYPRSRSSLIPAGAADPPPPSNLGLSPLSSTKSFPGQRNDRLPPPPRKTACPCSKCTSWSAPPACSGHAGCMMGPRCPGLGAFPPRSWSTPPPKPPHLFPHHSGPCGQNVSGSPLPPSPKAADQRAPGDHLPARVSQMQFSSQLPSPPPAPRLLQQQQVGGYPPPQGAGYPLGLQVNCSGNVPHGGDSPSQHLMTNGQMSLSDVSQRLAAVATQQRHGEIPLGGGGMQSFGPALPSIGGQAPALALAGLQSLETCQEWATGGGGGTTRGLIHLQRECTSPSARSSSYQQTAMQTDPKGCPDINQHLDRSPKPHQYPQQWSLPNNGLGTQNNPSMPPPSPPVNAIRASLSRPVALRPSPRTPLPSSHLGGMGYGGMHQVMDADMGWNFADWTGQLPPLFNTGIGRLGGPTLQTAPPVLNYGKKGEGQGGEEISAASAAGGPSTKEGLEEVSKMGVLGLVGGRPPTPSYGWGGLYAQERAAPKGVGEFGQSEKDPGEITYASITPLEYNAPMSAEAQIGALAKSAEEGKSSARMQSIYRLQNLPLSGSSNQLASALTPNGTNKRASSTQDATSTGAPLWLDQLAKRQREQ